MNCPDHDALSAFIDGQAEREEKGALEAHAEVCAACGLRLRSLRAAKSALAALPAPGMPAELREALGDIVPRGAPWWSAALAELGAGLRQRGATAALAGAICLVLALWARQAGVLVRRVELPAEFLAAAHDQYSLTLPLAPSERILSELPEQLAGSGEEERDVY